MNLSTENLLTIDRNVSEVLDALGSLNPDRIAQAITRLPEDADTLTQLQVQRMADGIDMASLDRFSDQSALSKAVDGLLEYIRPRLDKSGRATSNDGIDQLVALHAPNSASLEAFHRLLPEEPADYDASKSDLIEV